MMTKEQMMTKVQLLKLKAKALFERINNGTSICPVADTNAYMDVVEALDGEGIEVKQVAELVFRKIPRPETGWAVRNDRGR